MREFEITFESVADGVTVVNVNGWLDAHTFELMDQALQNMFESGHTRVIVNLANVDYISSAGAGVFIGALTTAQEHGGEIVLLAPTQPVREVFDLLGLSQIFKIADALHEAVSLVKG